MVPRTLAKKLRDALTRFPVVTLTGPRQSGKTTLVRSELRDYDYISLESPDQRGFALEDPRGFLAQFDGPVILDEVQRAPELFSYLQGVVDEKDRPGQFVLTGSQNFLLLEKISQSLAGRCAILHLLPFSLAELLGRPPLPLQKMGRKIAPPPPPRRTLVEVMFAGLYPRIHDKKLPPRDWLGSYYQTYLERDVRNVLKVGDLEAFSRFVRFCAGRNGQILNLSSLASDCGVTHTTARRWISVLEASFLIVLLRPYYRNFGKRLIKSPKLYFLDTGLLSFLLNIQSPRDLYQHALRGSLFESLVLSELYKNYLHQGELPRLSFWRDASGHEIDFLVEGRGRVLPVEVKSTETVVENLFSGIAYWRNLTQQTRGPAALIYGGDRHFLRQGVACYPWFAL